jgi:hypothetical protein
MLRGGAVDDYIRAIRLKPDYNGAHCDRGIAHYDLKEYQADYNKLQNSMHSRAIPANTTSMCWSGSRCFNKHKVRGSAYKEEDWAAAIHLPAKP